MNITVPIAEWAGSGTVNLAQNDVQYYYSTGNTWGTTNSSATTSQGQGGVLGGTTTPAGISFTYTFTPTSPIPVSAKPVLELSLDGTHWSPAGMVTASILIENLRYDGTNYIGAVAYLNATGQIVVTFGKYCQGTTTAWSGTWYWRVVVAQPGQAAGFGIVSGTSSGLLPASNTSLDDTTATRLGLKQYLHGTTYNGGNAPTVTLASGGGTLTSVTRALFVPYQMQDGTWRLKFNAMLAPSSTSRTSVQFAVFGVAAKNVSYQAIIATTTAASQLTTGYVTPGTGTIMIADHNGAAVTSTFYSFSGDIELDSKPTWAY
jgi:hypothetical protein